MMWCKNKTLFKINIKEYKHTKAIIIERFYKIYQGKSKYAYQLLDIQRRLSNFGHIEKDNPVQSIIIDVVNSVNALIRLYFGFKINSPGYLYYALDKK
jgi:hypothetical protein